jgi:hypothetical protein
MAILLKETPYQLTEASKDNEGKRVPEDELIWREQLQGKAGESLPLRLHPKSSEDLRKRSIFLCLRHQRLELHLCLSTP